jgi:cytidylate kinase
MQDTSSSKDEKSRTKKKSTETRVLPETALVDDPLPTGIPPEGSVVVTITRQFGSGGSDIAHLVAQTAGLNYIDQQIIASVAERLGVDISYATRQDEQANGMASNILEALRSSNPFNVHYMLSSTKAHEQSQGLAYFHLTQRVILELATQGNAIIIGRGSQFLLHNNPRTLHIYIFAPLETRIDYVMKQYHIAPNEAKELIEQRDDEQDSYQRHYYGADGRQPNFYHLLINTGLFSFESAANLIQQALPTIQKTA